MLRSIILTILVSAPLCAAAQTVSDVKFAKGNYGAMVSGTIIGDEYIDYRVSARGGQKMLAELSVTGSNGSGTVYFNILPPGSDGVAIYNSSMDGNAAKVDLQTTGAYTIRVYHMGDDEDSGKTSGFNIDLSVQ